MKNILPEAIDSLIRTYISTQTGIDLNYVRNAGSLYGSMLNKQMTTTIDDQTVALSSYESISPTDTVIYFTVELRDSLSNVSIPTEDVNETMTQVASYRINVMCYGDLSISVMKTMIARLRTMKVRLDLQNDGIYLEKVSEGQTVREFKANVCFLRTDVELDISCEHIISQISTDDRMTQLNILKTLRELNFE